MRWTALAVCCLLLATSACVAFDDWDQFHIVWQDEFDWLDPGKWQHEVTATGGLNNEFQLYTQDSANSFVKDGKLFIKPTLLADSKNPKTNASYGDGFMRNGVLNVTDSYGNCTFRENNGCYRTGANGNIPPVMSARLRSYQRFSFTYGRVVISAKMSVGDWLWPAIWMLPENWTYGGWPRSGEIDIVESVGNRDCKKEGVSIGIQKMASNLHWGPERDDSKWLKTNRAKHSDCLNYGDNFHNYTFEWSRNGLRFFVDDEKNALMDVPCLALIDRDSGWRGFWEWGKPWKGNYTNPWAGGSSLAPFDQAFHFVLNVAVGGTIGPFPDGCVNRGGEDPKQAKPWSNRDSYVDAMKKFYNERDAWKWTWDSEEDNNAMQIDYIRVYQRKQVAASGPVSLFRVTALLLYSAFYSFLAD